MVGKGRARLTGVKSTWFALSMMCIGAFFWLVTAISGECRAGEFRLAIDIGHTRKSPGAVSARGVPEYLFNKRIATLLYKKIRQDRRIKAFIINESGENISLADRAALAQRLGADLLISIHHDSVDPEDLSYWLYRGEIRSYCDKFAGHSIFYSEKNGQPFDSLRFATVLGTEMLRAGFCPTLHHAKKFTSEDKALIDRIRGIYKYNQLIVLKKATMPAVLFECGIIKSRTEELQLLQPTYQARMADALSQAIKKYVGGKNAHPAGPTLITPSRDWGNIPGQKILKE